MVTYLIEDIGHGEWLQFLWRSFLGWEKIPDHGAVAMAIAAALHLHAYPVRIEAKTEQADCSQVQ